MIKVTQEKRTPFMKWNLSEILQAKNALLIWKNAFSLNIVSSLLRMQKKILKTGRHVCNGKSVLGQ